MRIAVIAGEASGDILAAGLIRELATHYPDAIFEGVCGSAMRSEGCQMLADCEQLSVMGLTEVVRELPHLLGLRKRLLKHWHEQPPDLFVGVDAPDFNLGVAERLRRRGIRTVQYVCPSVWAWREKRVKKIRRSVDLVLCLLPFEKPFLEKHSVAAAFVGHPAADAVQAIPDQSAARSQLSLADGPVLALMPGSRRGEVSRLGADFVASAAWLAERVPGLQCVAAMANDAIRTIFEQQIESAAARPAITLRDGDADIVLSAADVVLAASGTVTLEAALQGKPTVACYRFAPSTYWLWTKLNVYRQKYWSLPNLLADRELVPEFLQDQIVVADIGAELISFLTDEQRRADVCREFATIKNRLKRDADSQAAAAIARHFTL